MMGLNKVKKRIEEYADKEIDYLVGYHLTKQNRELLKQIIVLGELLERFCFIESSLHLHIAKDFMIKDLRELEFNRT